MKIAKDITFTVSDVKELIDDASQSQIQEIYEYAKSEGDIDDECEDCDDCVLDLDNVLGFTENADNEDASKIFNCAAQNLRFFKIENLADQMKIEFINSIWDKYSQSQLEEIIKSHESKKV